MRIQRYFEIETGAIKEKVNLCKVDGKTPFEHAKKKGNAAFPVGLCKATKSGGRPYIFSRLVIAGVECRKEVYFGKVRSREEAVQICLQWRKAKLEERTVKEFGAFWC
ncbi:MAG: hypothetical protein V5786_00830 [Psychromonas sp.]